MPRARQSHHHDLHELERAVLDPLPELRLDIVEVGGYTRRKELQVAIYLDYDLISGGQGLVLAPLAVAFLVETGNLTLDPALHAAIGRFCRLQ